MTTYLVYYSCGFSGVTIIGLYCNQAAAIRTAMRKVYQILNVNATKDDGCWTWRDEYSIISILEIPIVDAKDLKGDSPLPQFLAYKDFINGIPTVELEKFRVQALNRRKVLEKLNKRG